MKIFEWKDREKQCTCIRVCYNVNNIVIITLYAFYTKLEIILCNKNILFLQNFRTLIIGGVTNNLNKNIFEKKFFPKSLNSVSKISVNLLNTLNIFY